MLAAGAQRGLQLQSMLRSFSSGAIASAAVPALSDTASSSGGWFSRLFGGGSKRIAVPMSEPLPGVTMFEKEDGYPSFDTLETTMSKLPNGLTFAAEPTPGPTCTVGVYVNSGSVYEEPHEAGISHLLEYMSFKSTAHRTHFRLVREVEGLGANVLASASREQMAYTMDVVRNFVPEAMEVLADSVLNPRFFPWEVAQAVEKMREDIKQAKENPQSVLLEGMHEVAYTGGLAKPLIAPESALSKLSSEMLYDFVARNYTASRMTVAGSGLMIGEVRGFSMHLFEGLPSVEPVPQPPSTYVGGDFRQSQTGNLTHAMLAFEFPGGWNDLKGSVAVTVLQFLLGGGGSFSAGGPGKGMHSRLYKRVLNKYDWIHNCTAFSSLYNHSGLVGIFVSAENSKANEAVDIIANELQALTKDLPKEQLERAKLAAISSVYMNLESRAVVAEDIGRQILTYGHRKSIPTFVDAIKKLTPDDISKVVSKMLKTAPTVAALGNITNVPRYDSIAARFR